MERAVLGAVALFLEGEAVGRGNSPGKGLGGKMLQRGSEELAMAFHCG